MNSRWLSPDSTPPCPMSVVVPVFNEEAVLLAFHRRLTVAVEPLGVTVEIVYVDDGSQDRSRALLQLLHVSHPTVSVVHLSRNFGKEAAITAGLDVACGDCVVVMDSDLQHPPESIPAMVEAWRKGADVVNMRRRSREDETWVKRTAANAFYGVLNRLSDIPIPEDVGDFRLLSRRAVDALKLLHERNRFMKGLFAWIGYRQVTLEFDCGERASGQSKWRYRQLWHFAVEGITAFSVAPLRFASHAGLISALVAFGYALYFLFKTLILGDTVPGFPTLIVVVLLLGGLQLLAIGVLGEYLGRLSLESKRRPLYLVDEYTPATNLVATHALPSV
ncbi:MAG: glycosyltransferase family 2 protein, partial [Thermoleophilia bacterium]|nr:glycosyltransferase family 2 protein [Thermoleophilia bacterium]